MGERGRETNDFRKSSFKSIPLRFILFPPLGLGEGVVEFCGVGPELEFLKGGFAFE
jgi:hypothetical protein